MKLKIKGDLELIHEMIREVSQRGSIVRGLNKWLDKHTLPGVAKTDICPYRLINAGRPNWCYWCKKLFPEINVDVINNHECPCDVYDARYVRQVANAILKAYTGNLLKKIEKGRK